MKIRTDFVTNSSSSSYCVQVIAEDDQDRLYLLEAVGAAAEQYGSDDEDAIHPQISCPAGKIADAASLEELQELLIKNSKGISKKKVNKWIESIKTGSGDLSHVRRITLKRFLDSWGEGSGCTVLGDENLQQLAGAYMKASKAEKDEALKRFVEYLDKAEFETETNWGDAFPSGFCGKNKTKARYYWEMYSTEPEKLAKMIVDGKIKYDDFGEERVTIDYPAHTVSREARFIINGDRAPELAIRQRGTDYIRKIMEDRYKDLQPADEAEMLSLIPMAHGVEQYHILYLKNKQPSLLIAVVPWTMIKQKAFKDVKKECEKAGIPYIILEAEKENIGKKITEEADVKLGLSRALDINDLKVLPEDAPFRDLKTSGETGWSVKVRFADNRAYAYKCFEELQVGDIVLVEGAKAGMPGYVIEILDNTAPLGYRPVVKVLSIN